MQQWEVRGGRLQGGALWKSNNSPIHTARRLLEERAGRHGVEVDRRTKKEGITPLIQAATQQFTYPAMVLLEH